MVGAHQKGVLMKRALLRFAVALATTCLAVLVLSGPALAISTGNGGWRWQSPLPQGERYTGGYFTDAEHGWLISGGDIFHTSNGGVTLTVQARASVAFAAITFVGARHGWAVGGPAHAGGPAIVYRTVNGGKSWGRVRIRRAGIITAVSFATTKVGWAVCGNAVLHTVDGGSHWAILRMHKHDWFNGVQALGPREAWVSGNPDTLLHTVNGGATWRRSHTGTHEDHLNAIRFTSRSNGWVAGGADIIHTADGGADWTVQIATVRTVSALSFADSHDGWAASTDTIYRTTDGGAHWLRPAGAPSGSWVVALTPADAVVGDGVFGAGLGELSRTFDGGATWQSSTHAPAGTADLAALQFVSATTGWAAGAGGEIIKTADGGVSWSPQASGTTQNLSALKFIDAQHGWAVGDQGVIVHTTDGGATWTAQTSGVVDNLSGVTFVDAQHGWAVGTSIYSIEIDGTNAVLLATSDGGLHWTQQTTPLVGAKAALNDVVFADALHGWAVGVLDDGGGYLGSLILATTNGGATWVRQLAYYPPLHQNTGGGVLHAIACIDAKHLVAVGSDDNVCEIFRTANGGKTWTRFVQPAAWQVYPFGMDYRLDLRDVVFADALHGWAVGDGTVLRTTNGGVTWAEQPVGTDVGLNALSFVSPTHGWVAGDNGNVLTTTTAGATP